MTSVPASAPLVSERRLAIVGAALVSLGPVSLALYTPAMPQIADAFATSSAAVQMTLTAFFGGFAVAQLVCGPLSDAFGRKPIGLLFLALYVAGSLAAALAPTIDTLLAARLLQGIGAAAGIALARAMVRDLFTGAASARIMNLIGIMLAVGPAISPAIGGAVLHLSTWHAIFVVMLVYGVILVVVLQTTLPETLAIRDTGKIQPAVLLTNYWRLLSDPTFMRPSLLIGITVGGLYALATMLPFVMIDHLGLEPYEYGFTMLLQTAAYTGGGLAARQMMMTMPAGRLVPIGLAIVVVSGIALAVVLRLVDPSVPVIMAPVMVWAFGIALIVPACQTAALADVPHIAGAASALMGFIQMSSGFAAGIAAKYFADQVDALATVLPTLALFAVIVYFGPGRRAFAG